MCGIAGLVLRRRRLIGAAEVVSLVSSLRHRGPDDRGILWSSDAVVTARNAADRVADLALVHTRLSIIDLSAAGWQPMSTADGRHHIVFNGEIYNYRELREELRRDGEAFATESDTEVLLRIMAREGPAGLVRLTGMFAFALLDAATGRLLLARDGFGIKPLYLAEWRDGLAFASEIPPLLDLPGVPRTADPAAAVDYLRYGYTDRGDRTMFARIRQLRPGHWLEIDTRTATAGPQRAYWRPAPRPEATTDEAGAAEELRAAFMESVKLHMRSDVPLGFFLSGGIDSSAVLAAARRLEPDHELRTFSYVAPGAPFDETRWIGIAADAARAPNRQVAISGADFRAGFRAWTRHMGEPVGASNVFAGFHVARLARENGVTVCLDGQGGDEICGGYSRLLAVRVAGLISRGKLAQAGALARRAARLGLGFGEVLPQIVEQLPIPLVKDALRAMYGRHRVPEWLNADWMAAAGVDIFATADERLPGRLADYTARMLVDYTIPRFMRYGDRNSMAHSLELRVPFLTPRLADLMMTQPDVHFVDDRAMVKSLFRRAMRGIVPDTILDRRDKIGYETPEADWLREDADWTRRWLDAPAIAHAPYLRADVMKAELDSFLEGRRAFHHRYFRWINFACWADEFGVAVA